jgi:hypothetical protein
VASYCQTLSVVCENIQGLRAQESSPALVHRLLRSNSPANSLCLFTTPWYQPVSPWARTVSPQSVIAVSSSSSNGERKEVTRT